MKYKVFLGFFILIFISVIYYFQTDTIASYGPEKEKIIETKTYTAFDSLIFRYDSLITSEIDGSATVGAALAVIHKGDIAFMKCFGVKKQGENEPVNAHTVFRLASVSKTITGVLAGILAEEKAVGLDDRVVDYIPDFRLKDSLSTYGLTVRHLLSHTSGLVPHAYDNLVEAGLPMTAIMDSLFRVNISGAPGLLYGYQNVLFSLYDTIAALKTSKSFDQLLTEKLFIPFGMRNASAGYHPFSSNNNKAYPHIGYYGGKYRALPLNNRYYNTIPAAGINASIMDMARFLIALSDRESTHSIHRIADSVMTPQVVSPLRWHYLRKWDRVDSKHYGLGWRLIGYKGRNIAYHGGYVQGYRSEIALCREEEIGIAFLTNSPNRVGSMVVPSFLDMYFEREGRKVNGKR